MELLKGVLLVEEGNDDAEIESTGRCGSLSSPLVTSFSRLPVFPLFAAIADLGLLASLSRLALVARFAGLPLKPGVTGLALAALVPPLALIGASLAALLPAVVGTLLLAVLLPLFRLPLLGSLFLLWLRPPIVATRGFRTALFRRGLGLGGAGCVAVHALDGTRLRHVPLGAVVSLWFGLRRRLVVLEILVGHWGVVLGVTV